MAITLQGDPIMELADAHELFGIKDPAQTKLLVNSLTRKFMSFTGRVRIGTIAATAIVERLRGNDGSPRLWLHGAPIDTDQAVEAQLYVDGAESDLYTLADGDIQVVDNDDRACAIELLAGSWPCDDGSGAFVQVTYFGGWSETPGDVLEGALLQGRVDLNRADGVVGMESKSAGGESTRYDTAGIIKPVRELWTPYKVL